MTKFSSSSCKAVGWARIGGLGNTSAKLAKVGPVCPDSLQLQLLTSTEKVDIFLVDKSLHTFTKNWKIVRHIAPQDSCWANLAQFILV